MKQILLIALFAIMLTGCQSCPDLTAMKVDAQGHISWDDAQKIIVGCDVDSIMQTHARLVTIHTKDGRKFQSIEPKLDDVRHLMVKHGLEDKIPYLTE